MEVKSLIELAGTGNLSTLEEEWLRVLTSEGLTPSLLSTYSEVVAELVVKGHMEAAETLITSALETLVQDWEGRALLGAVAPLALQLKKSTRARKGLAELYRKTYEGEEGLEALIREAGLEEGRPVRRAVQTLEVCLSIRVGSYAVDRLEQRVARVIEVERQEWIVRYSENGREYSRSAVEFADHFDPVADHDFRVQRVFDREELILRLDRSPAEVVIQLCRARGNRITSLDLEQVLVPDLIASEGWKGWWTKARAQLRSLPHVEVSGRSPYVIELQEHVETLEARYGQLLEHAISMTDRCQTLESYVRDCQQQKQRPDAAFLEPHFKALGVAAERRAASGDAMAFRDVLLAERTAVRLGAGAVEPLSRRLLELAANPAALLGRPDDDGLRCEALNALRTARPSEWKGIYLEQLLTSSLPVCEHISHVLVEEERLGLSDFRPIVEKIIANPVDHFEAFLWLYDGPKYADRICDVPLLTLLTKLLGVLNDLRRKVEGRDPTVTQAFARARSVLSLRKYERFRAVIDDLDLSMAQAIRGKIKGLDRLGRAVPDELLALLTQRHPQLILKPKKEPAWLREDVIYVTREGRSKRKSEIDYHVNVKMKENARSISAAAEHGDLSENSEYKFALEERDLLRARLGQMEEEFSKSKILDPAKVPSEFVGIGNRVHLRNAANGKMVTVTFTGPWEADIDRGFYNYMSPFAQSMMGRKIGSKIQIDLPNMTGEYEIVGLENGLT